MAVYEETLLQNYSDLLFILDHKFYNHIGFDWLE